MPPIKKVSNFYHLEMKSYDSFEGVIKQYYKNDSILLPYVIEIQEYVKKKGITLCTSTLFDVEVTDFPLSEIDLFIEFVNEKNGKLLLVICFTELVSYCHPVIIIQLV